MKGVIVPYLFQLQFKADDSSVGEMQGDQWPRAGPATGVLETLVIYTLTSAEPSRPWPEAAGAVEQVPLDKERPDRMVQLGEAMAAPDRQSLLFLLQECKDAFTFGPEEMSGIAPAVMEYQLNMDPTTGRPSRKSAIWPRESVKLVKSYKFNHYFGY